MTAENWLAEHFEEHRGRLRAVAFRILGSRTEADDALQEAWVRVQPGGGDIENPARWLTTVVARVCFDMLLWRTSRREVPVADSALGEWTAPEADPETELLLADSVGPALRIVLEMLAPPERVAFVLHDLFDVPFDEIAPIVGRSPAATRQLASRARRRVRGGADASDAELAVQHQTVSAFLAASRNGDLDALLAVLDPNATLRADSVSIQTAAETRWGGRPELPRVAQGARAVADSLLGRARGVQAVLLDGTPAAVAVHSGQTRAAWIFAFDEGKILEIDLVMDPARLARFKVQTQGVAHNGDGADSQLP